MERLKSIALADLGAGAGYALVFVAVRLVNYQVHEKLLDDPVYIFIISGFMTGLVLGLVPIAITLSLPWMEDGGKRVQQYVFFGMLITLLLALVAGSAAVGLLPPPPAFLRRHTAWEGFWGQTTMFGMMVLPFASLLVSLPLAAWRERQIETEDRQATDVAQSEARRRYLAMRDQQEQERNAP